MKKNRMVALLTVFLLSLTGCSKVIVKENLQKKFSIRLADSLANRESVFLYNNLKELSTKGMMLAGHHEATAYGIGWKGDSNRSDIKDITGQHPALYGWDFGFLWWEKEPEKNPIAKLTLEAYQRGGVNTYCWHYNNPASGKSFYDTTRAVGRIIPGGDLNSVYNKDLDKIAAFLGNLKNDKGEMIPIIFRPFHEFDGNWFWWGNPFCSDGEFIKLWQYTVHYLRDVKGLRNLLYAFSPDRKFETREELIKRYPGDDYVDIIGMDNYYDFGILGDGIEGAKIKLRLISDLAKEKNKLAAFTETGVEKVPYDKWWSDVLYSVIKDTSIQISYFMLWRNADSSHHYAPALNHPSRNDFIDFSKAPSIIFQNEIINIYNQEYTSEVIKKIELNKVLNLLKNLMIYKKN